MKAKAAKIKKALIGTGGGPPTTLVLTRLEEELIAFLGKVVAEGVKGVIDPLEAEVPVCTILYIHSGVPRKKLKPQKYITFLVKNIVF